MLKPQSIGQAARAPATRPVVRAIPAVRPRLRLIASRTLPKLPWSAAQPTLQRRVAQVVAAQPGGTPSLPVTDSTINFKKSFWTFLDVVAILGSVGGALAAILNLFTGTYVLFLPLVLPVVSLLSALQREGLIAEDNRRAYDTLRLSLARDSSALLADARGAIEEVRRELKGQNTTAARLGTIEARLSSLEGSILSAGRSAREAAAGLGVLPERLQAEQRAALEGLVGAMRLELRRAAESLANNETTALARLDARLAAVEGSLSGLEVAQSEGLRRLSMSLNSALADAEATLQSSVRNEVARSMEPVRRLPQMLAAALPPALAAAEAVDAATGGPGLVGPGGAAAGAAAAPTVAPEQLQAIVGQEVEGAVGRILAFQADAFGRLNTPRPVSMDEEQWSALGRRLTRLERLVEGVPGSTEAALIQGGQLAAAVAAAVREAVAVQVAEVRGEVAAAAAREAEGVRNDILAAEAVVREGLEGLAAALQPLQLGLLELQIAVAAVAEAQRAQQALLQQQLQQVQQQAVLTSQEERRRREEAGEGVEGEGAVVPPRGEVGAPQQQAVGEKELSRLLEGVAAVAQLLLEVDAKVDSLAAAMAQLPGETAAAAAAAATAAAVAASMPVPEAAAAGAPLSSSPSADGEATAAAASAAAAALAAAEEARQQRRDLRSGIDSMREVLASLAVQVGALAAAAPQQGPSIGAPAAPATAATVELPEVLTPPSPSPAVADVVAFEADLAAMSTSAAAVGGAAAAAAGGRPAPATAGVSQEEAYDMMMQLAEARRRSGSEASSSGRTAGGVGTAGRSAGVQGAGAGGGQEVPPGAAAGAAAEMHRHLRIEGLPPFEQQQQGPASELPPLPPSQSEMEGRIAPSPLQRQQQQQEQLLPQQLTFPQQRQEQSQQLQQQQPTQWEVQEAELQPPQQTQQSLLEVAYDNGSGGSVPYEGSIGGPMEQQFSWQQQPLQQQPQQQVPYMQQQPYSQAPPPTQPTSPSPAFNYSGSPAPAASLGPFSAASPPYYSEPLGAAAPMASPGFGASTTPGGPASAPPSPSPSPPPPPGPAPPQPATPGLPDYRMRPLEGLSGNEMIAEGLRLLRLGREETRKGEDYGLADSHLQSSIAAFTAAAEAAPAPGDAKALGNLGNALLARGELKAAYLEALRSGPPPASFSESEAQRGAEVAMTGEANALLTQAGVQFMKVLELEGWSSRALVNWGRALVIRADLLATCPDGGAALLQQQQQQAGPGGPGTGPGAASAASSPSAVTQVVAQLYTSAINKFEGVLEGEPGMVPAKYRCALAMAGLSRTRPPGSREALTLLADAVNYLRDVLASPHPDAEALRPAAGAALQQCEETLMAARGAR